MEKAKQIKLAVSAVAFIGAALLLAYNFGLISTEKPPPSLEETMTPEEKQDFERRLEEAKTRPPSSRG